MTIFVDDEQDAEDESDDEEVEIDESGLMMNPIKNL